MAIKEIYYINLYYNENSTNVKDVYDKPNDLGFNDKWIKYDKDIENEEKIFNNWRGIPDYERIYVVEIKFYYENTLTLYYTGGYDKEGLPNMSENSIEARRFSSLDTINRLKSKFKKLFQAIYPNLEDDGYDIVPGIYRDNEISDYLFNYYNYGNKLKSKELFFKDQYLDMKQGLCMADISYSYYNTEAEELSKILKETNLSISEYQSKLRRKFRNIESKRIDLRKDPEWEDPIWNEEFVKPYIKNNYDPDKALKELFENRKNGNKNFTFELHKCFLPEGYTDVN